MSKLVFVLRSLTESEINNLASKNWSKNDFLLFENDSFIDSRISQNIKCESIYSQKISLESYNQNIMASIVNFGHIIIGNKSIAELLKIDSNLNSYWYYLRFSLYQRSKLILIQRFLIQEITKKFSKGYEVVVFGESEDSIVGIDHKINFIQKEHKNNPLNSLSSISKKLVYLLKYFVLFLYRSLLGSILNSFRRVIHSSTLIITNTYNQQAIFDLKTAKLIEGDPHLHYLLEKTIHDNNINYLSQIKPPSLENPHQFSIKNYFKKNQFSKKTIYFEPFLFRSLLSISFYRDYKRIKQTWKEITLALSKKTLSLEDEIILESLKKLSKLLILACWREHAAYSLGKYLELKKVVAIDEHALQNQSIFNAFKQQKVKTIAIQHGAISSGNMAYKFSKEDICYSPFPDLTLIRGKYTEEMLINQHYPKEKVKIVGHLRTDAIAVIKSTKTKLNLFPNSKDRPLVVYATQPIPSQEQSLKKRLTKDFFKLCDEFSQYDFVLKPHPNEGSLKLYEEHAAKLEHPNFKFYDGNLYKLLAETTVLITYFSTVGIEAIYFNKPLITIDYFQIDAQGYLKDGVSLNATNYKELREYLNQVIKNGSSVSHSKIKKFIENRVYKIDGKVAERCYEVI